MPSQREERLVLAVGEDLVRDVPVAHLLADRGFRAKGWQEVLGERGTTLLTTPDRKQRREWSEGQRRFVAAHRNRIESGISVLKERFNLEGHGARSFWGLLTRVCGKLAAYTLYRFWRLSNPAMQVVLLAWGWPGLMG